MGDIVPGITFSDIAPGNAVNAAKLGQLVSLATIQPSFVTGMADGSSTIADGDYLAGVQLSSGAFRKFTVVSIKNAATAAAIAAIPFVIGPTAPGATFQDAVHAWLKVTVSSGQVNFGTSGLRLWDAASSKFRRIYNTPVGSAYLYVGSGTFDTTGLGTGAFDGWALMNGSNGTTTKAAPSDGVGAWMQFIGYNS